MVTEKAVAYITQGDNLLVFRHPLHPEAGIQVPAGTIEEDESPEEAVMREAWEETGLNDLEMCTFLGVRECDLTQYGLGEVRRCFFYHLEFRGQALATWRHYETDPSDGSPGPIELEFFWARLPDQVPELSGGQGELLSRLARDEDVPGLSGDVNS